MLHAPNRALIKFYLSYVGTSLIVIGVLNY